MSQHVGLANNHNSGGVMSLLQRRKKTQIFRFLNIQFHAICYLLSIAQSVFQMLIDLISKATLKT